MTVIGYVPGAYDLLHVGHLRILERSRRRCDRLIVGVVGDALAEAARGERPAVALEERMRLVAALPWVDEVVEDVSSDKSIAWERHRFDVVFKGDDWLGTDRGDRLEAAMAAVGAEVVYLPYTREISSTMLRAELGSAAR
ncbi:MAG: adenylyltransferase/cytidyltransferase family protein [Acidimicrobiales bacterium]